VHESLVGPTVWTGRALQDESAEWLTGLALLYPALWWSGLLLAIMDIRAHSISFPRSALARPVGPPDHECDGETVLPSPQIQLADLGGVSLSQVTQGSTEAIPSEPPSLARLTRRAAVAERDGGRHPFGEPERAHLKPLRRWHAFRRCDPVQARSMQCERACWPEP
jgi:hypothetical protein